MLTADPGRPPAPLLSTAWVPSSEAERLARSARRGDLIRLAPGMFTPSEVWRELAPWDRHLLTVAAVSARSPEAVLCRETALLIHGLPVVRTPKHVHIRTSRPERAGRDHGPTLTTGVPRLFRHEPALPRGTSRRTAREQHRAGTELDSIRVALPPTARAPQDLRVRVDPLPLTVFDTVPRMPGGAALAVMDALAGRSSDDPPWETEAFVAQRPMLGPRRREAQFDELAELADARSGSPGESVSRWVLHRHGLAAPSLQHPITLRGRGTAYADFAWVEAGVLGEFDGLTKYSGILDSRPPADVVVAEKLREDALRAQGWTVVRWVWSDLQNPERLVARLLRAGVPPA
ncbi:MAG: hypothetical protein Q4F53_06535 [Nesterenkonia sp.]|nr:hypothetical protein [Nesterenkonia sp.]